MGDQIESIGGKKCREEYKKMREAVKRDWEDTRGAGKE